MIWKYPLQLTDLQTLDMPAAAKILSVANQSGTLCLWAQVDDSAPHSESRAIEIIGTGNPIKPHRREFIATVLMDGFVWHVFEQH